MKRSFKFQLRPTTRQGQSLAACIEDHRQLYNAALKAAGGVPDTPGVDQLRRPVRATRRRPPGYLTANGQGAGRSVPSRPPSGPLDDSFDCVLPPGQGTPRLPGYPRFKGRGWFDTVEWPKDRDGCQ